MINSPSSSLVLNVKIMNVIQLINVGYRKSKNCQMSSIRSGQGIMSTQNLEMIDDKKSYSLRMLKN